MKRKVFSQKDQMGTRNQEVFKINTARTESLKKSPLTYTNKYH